VYPTFLRLVLKVSYHLLRGLSSDNFLSGFPTKIWYAMHVSSMKVSCPAHFIFTTDTLAILKEECKL
jgi:hypothetical protein